MKSRISRYWIAGFCAVIIIATLPACSRTANKVAPPDSEATKPSELPADYVLSIRFLSETPIELDPNARVKVDVWGYDKFVVDVSATRIKSVIIPLTNLDDAVVVPFSREDLETVEHQTGNKETLGYYFTFKFDTNGDGKTGSGDYGWDYEKTDMILFGQK